MRTRRLLCLAAQGLSWTRLSLCVCVLWFAACARAFTPTRPQPTPDVILISIDALRADRLNAYGYKARRVSPAIDALARDGILFSTHVAGAPWTLPSHLTLLTSLSPSAHGVSPAIGAFAEGGSPVSVLPASRVTLAERLRGAGFRTGAFTGGGFMAADFGFGQGFEDYDASRLVKLGAQGQGVVQEWISRKPGPYFLFLHTYEVHAPYVRTDYLNEVLPADKASEVGTAVRRLGESREVLEGNADPRSPHGEVLERALLSDRGVFSQRVTSALYDGGIRHADGWLADLFSWLKATGRYDRTLIVLTSDHGEELGDRGGPFYNTHGGTVFNELVHVPLVVKLPLQREAGRRVTAVTRAVDVMPTILHLAGVRGGESEMEGRILSADVASRPALSEAVLDPWEVKGFRDGRYKLIVRIPAADVAALGRGVLPARVRRSLFDLETDPGERTNLLARPAAEARPSWSFTRPSTPIEIADRLDSRLRAQLASSRSPTERATLSPETRERLRSLGYVR